MKRLICGLAALLAFFLAAYGTAETAPPLPTPAPAERRAGDWRYIVGDEGVTLTRYVGRDAQVTVPEKLAAVLTGQEMLALYRRAKPYPDMPIWLAAWIPSAAALAAAPDKEVRIELPVQKLGEGVFKGNRKLTSVSVPDGITQIADSAFYGCRNLRDVRLPAGLGQIGNRAFYRCAKLEQLQIPSSVTLIGYAAFEGCTRLAQVQLPDGLRTIRTRAFKDCSALEEIKIPPLLSWTGARVFEGTPWLGGKTEAFTVIGDGILIRYGGTDKTVAVPPNVKRIVGAFQDNRQITSVYLTGSVTVIGYYAFAGCTQLTGVYTADSLLEIQDYAFDGCRRLTELCVPEGLASIGAYALRDCSALSVFAMPASLKSIGAHAFSGCAKLVAAQIPAGVQELQQRAFSNCRNLASVSIPPSVVSIASDAFNGCGRVTLSVEPGSIAEAYAKAKGIGYIAAADGGEERAPLLGRGAYTFARRGGEVVITGYQGAEAAVTLPSRCDLGEVTVVGTGALAGNAVVAAVVVPDGYRSIEDGAFISMERPVLVTLPDSVVQIGERAFAGSDVQLQGRTDSYARQYAEQNGIQFLILQ